MRPDPIVIYIAGASRSGSTLIEDYLSRNLGGVPCGELYRISQFATGHGRKIREAGALETCACGSAIIACPFWCAVSKEAGLDLGETVFQSSLSRWQRALFRFCVIFFGPKMTKLMAKLVPAFRREFEVGENCLRIYRAVSHVANVNLIVDSSKQAHQYFILRAVAPANIRLVTLLRDGRAVVSSMTRGARGDDLAQKIKTRKGHSAKPNAVSEEAVKAWVAYTFNGLIAFAFSKSRRRAIMRYEEFCDDPNGEVNRIAQHFSLPKYDYPHVCHAIGGSPARNTKGFNKIEIEKCVNSDPLLYSAKPMVIIGRALNWLLGFGGGRFVKRK